MSRDEVIATLRADERELCAAGVVSLSLFGSVARGEAQAGSDIDVVVRLREDIPRTGFAYFGRLAAVSSMLQQILGRPVDVIPEPIRKEELRRTIEIEAALAF